MFISSETMLSTINYPLLLKHICKTHTIYKKEKQKIIESTFRCILVFFFTSLLERPLLCSDLTRSSEILF